MCDKVVSEDRFMLKYCLDKYKAQEMCYKAVDSCLLALKFVRDWFVTNEMIEKLDGYIIFGDLDSDFVTLFSEDLGPNSVILDNNNLDDEHFDYCNLETINHVRFTSWYNRYKQGNASKKRRMKNYCL